MSPETRAAAIRAAFDADNWKRVYTDDEYADQIAGGYTEYLERIVDAVIATLGEER